jgi:8-oxo-dGTP diphosphatase
MKHKNPGSTADIIVEKEKEILLVKRKHGPFKGMWALPGGFLEYEKETLEETAARELNEETNLIVKSQDLEQMKWYSNPKRDPRYHIIAHVYVAKKFKGHLKAGDDAANAKFFPIESLPELAFDHRKIIKDYLLLNGRYKEK